MQLAYCGEEQQQLLVYVVDGNGPNLIINSMKASNNTEVSNKLAAKLQKHDARLRYIHRNKGYFRKRLRDSSKDWKA